MVMGDITRIDTVQQYCDLFEVEALHPLVSVVNCYEVQPIRHSKKLYNIYAVLLKDTDCGTMNGQTGKMVGDLPTSKGKFWGLFAAIAAPMTVVLTIILMLS